VPRVRGYAVLHTQRQLPRINPVMSRRASVTAKNGAAFADAECRDNAPYAIYINENYDKLPGRVYRGIYGGNYLSAR